MPRLHLFEFHEKSWCPAIFRDLTTEYLHFITTAMDAYAPLTPHLQEALRHSDPPQILDLCSGAGGSIRQVQAHLQAATGQAVPVLLSDLFPNEKAFAHASGGGVAFLPEPVDVRQVPTHLKGLRTLFNAFHHFRPAEARDILASAVTARQPIALIEANDHGWLPALPVLLLAPLMVILTAPLVKPFRWARLLWTWLIPVMPLLITWDGIVSILRVYSPAALRAMTAEFPTYHWETGKIRHKGATLIYLTGWPLPAKA